MTELDFVSKKLITKGWSEDIKYHATKADGTEFLLRISPIERFETRKLLFDLLQKVADLDIPMCKPVKFGVCSEGVYSLHTWIHGKDAEEAVPFLSEADQYMLGYKSGEILRKIHSIPAPSEQENWAVRFNRKTDYKIQKYRECELKFAGDDKVIEYIEQNRYLLENRPQCFQHGDYHIGNMMIENGQIVIIDFDRYDFGDPWEEFNRIVWCAQSSPCFATGQLNGYFGSEPPLEFFKLMAFYISSNTLSSIYWAIPFGQAEIDTMMRQSQDVLSWYDNMRNPVPTWYLKGFIYVKDTVEAGSDALACSSGDGQLRNCGEAEYHNSRMDRDAVYPTSDDVHLTASGALFVRYHKGIRRVCNKPCRRKVSVCR